MTDLSYDNGILAKNKIRYHGLTPAESAPPQKLRPIPAADFARVVRCEHNNRNKRGALEPCGDPAVDACGELKVCQRHLGLFLELAAQLPGVTIELTAGDGR